MENPSNSIHSNLLFDHPIDLILISYSIVEHTVSDATQDISLFLATNSGIGDKSRWESVDAKKVEGLQKRARGDQNSWVKYTYYSEYSTPKMKDGIGNLAMKEKDRAMSEN